MGGHKQKKRYDGGKRIQIRIEPNKTRTKRFFLWIEENYSHRPHLRGRFRDFGKLDDWSNNKINSETQLAKSLYTGRARQSAREGDAE
jgi:hypothetical protein